MTGFRSVCVLLPAIAAVFLLQPLLRQPETQFDLVETRHGFSVMRHEVSISQWRTCVDDGGCSHLPKPRAGAMGDAYPVTDIGALDAQEFVAWAQTAVDPELRLPTLDEWNGVLAVAPKRPNTLFTDPRLAWAASYGSEAAIDPTLRVSGAFGVNAEGIADLKGNVWEWTSSCVLTMPPDDVARHCPAYFAVGEHVARVPVFVRDPSAGGCATGTPPAHLGLRLVKTTT